MVDKKVDQRGAKKRIKKRKVSLILITFIAVSITAVSAQTFQSDIQPQNNTTTYNQSLTPSDQGVHAKFNEIANKPYDEQNYNCLNKSKEFGDYLLSKNATGVYFVIITHESDQYNHAAIIWQGVVFDPTNQPALYAVDPGKYYSAMSELGFNGHIEESYTPDTKNYIK